MLQNYKIVRVKKGESPPLAVGEMLTDNENKILYLGVGEITTDPDQKEVNENG